MAHHPSSAQLPSGFRRRFPLELSPTEYELLDAAGIAHGSKRAALLAGLAALEALTSSEHERALAIADRDAALARVAELEATVVDFERARTTARGSSTRARKDADAAKAGLSEMTRQAELAEADRRDEREARMAAEKKLNWIARERVDELRCPRCSEFVSSAEWAEQPTPEGRLVFHKRCGFHRGGLLDHTSVLGRRHQE